MPPWGGRGGGTDWLGRTFAYKPAPVTVSSPPFYHVFLTSHKVFCMIFIVCSPKSQPPSLGLELSPLLDMKCIDVHPLMPRTSRWLCGLHSKGDFADMIKLSCWLWGQSPGPWVKGCRPPLEGGKGQETDSPPELLERMWPSRPILESDHQNSRLINVWFSSTKFGDSLQQQ